MSDSLAHPVSITRYNREEVMDTLDLLAVEEPLEIRIGYGPLEDRMQKAVSVTMRTPGNDFELALGFLFTEGIIHDQNQIARIKYCSDSGTKEDRHNVVRVELKPDVEIDFSKLQRNFYTTSSCGVCGKESIDSLRTVCHFIPSADQLQVNPELLIDLPQKLRAEQAVFEHTGGLHACALFDSQGNLELVREDVGRHNALDKLIGACLGSTLLADFIHLKLPLENHILMLSGRASFELIQKAAMAGIRIVCAVGAPSSLAVQTAEAFGITLIGFLRDQRFNMYTHKHRIRLTADVVHINP